MSEPLPHCVYCEEVADGPMFTMGTSVMAHVDCVLMALNELIDPDWEPGRIPERIVGWLREVRPNSTFPIHGSDGSVQGLSGTADETAPVRTDTAR